MKCENNNCKNIIPDSNIDRVCAGNTDHLVEYSERGYMNYRTCNCCDKCRDECSEESHKDDTEPF